MFSPFPMLRPGFIARWQRLLVAGGTLLAAVSSGAAAINWFTPNPDYSIARNWNERVLEGIRMDTPHPPGQARNLFSFSVCMYDAWAAFDTNAVGFAYRGKHTATDVAAARREAISYAMYRMMLERHAFSRTATNQADRTLRPLARRAASTRRPPLVAIRARNPWRRLRTRFEGWNVRFIAGSPCRQAMRHPDQGTARRGI